MVSTDTIRTDTWIISIPNDWIEKGQTEDGALYFESSDGSKGIYISTWHIADTDVRTSEQVAESFKAVGLRSLQNMEGYSWHTETEEMENLSDSTVSITDALAEAKCYRIVEKILSRPPVVVRAAFHDYDCKLYHDSLACFAPIIQSLRFYDGAV